MRRLLTLLMLILTVAPAAEAATYYVGKSGSDANSCVTAQSSTAGARKLTITSGNGCLTTAGDTLIVGDGTYVEGHINLTVSGSSGNPITIRAENQQLAILSSTSGCNPNISFNASYRTIDGLRSQIDPTNVMCAGGHNSANGAFVRMWGSNTPTMGGNESTGYQGGTVKNCYIVAHAHRSLGIKSNQDGSLVENCTSYSSLEGFNAINQVFRSNSILGADAWGTYFTCKGGARNCQFYSNLIRVNVNWGGLVLGGNSSCCWWDASTHIEGYNQVAYNNVIIIDSGNGNGGITFTGTNDSAAFNNVVINGKIGMSTGSQGCCAPQPVPTNTSLLNNIVSSNGAACTYNMVGTNSTITNNNFFNCTGAPTQSTAITGNPLFVNATSDWHLQAGSPASGTGMTVTRTAYNGSSLTVNLDRDGVARSVPWSLGLYAGAAPADTTPPTTPTASASLNGGSQATVSWTAANDASGIAGYTIRRCTGAACTPSTSLSTVSGATLSYVDTGLSAGTTYGYSVNAFDSASNQSAFSATTYVTTSSTYSTLSAIDSFSRADGNLGASWDDGYTAQAAFGLVSNQLRVTAANTNSLETYNGVATPNDQWCQVTLVTVSGTGVRAPGCLLRFANAPTVTGYDVRAQLDGTDNGIRIQEHTAGALATLSTGTSLVTWQAGDKVRGEIEGTALRAYQVRGSSKTLIASVTDASIASGKTGMAMFVATGVATDAVQIDDFAMGGFSGTPPVAPSIASVDASTTQATVTYANAPTHIRVETATVSVVEPIASFPSGVYTYPDSISASLGGSICFYARNVLGEESPPGLCDTTITTPDSAPPVLANALPSGTLPSGTTSTTISVSTDEPATCRFDTSDVSYGLMPSPMASISLSHSADVGGLTNGSTTLYYVRCIDAAGNANSTSTTISVQVAAAPQADVTAPTAPSNLVAVPLSQTQAELVWTASTDAVGVTGYTVYGCQGAGCTNYSVVQQSVPSTTFVVALSGNTSYTFVVLATDAANNLSAYSNAATALTGGVIDYEVPSTMTNLTAVPYSASVKLTWNAGTDNSGVVFSIIEQCQGAGCVNFVVAKTDIAGTQLIRSLSPATVYCFRGKHSDISGNVSAAYSATVCTTTTTSGLGQPRASSAQRPAITVPRAARQ